MSEFDCMTAPLTGRIFVEASAGTGKTYAIEHVVLRLIDTLPLDAILVTTFTRAGVRDLKQRLYETLKRNIDEAPIYTIHGFCHRMLSEYAFESGMSLSSIDPNKGFHKEGTERAILDTLRTLDDLTPAELKRLMAPFHRETAAFVKKMIQYLSSHPIIPERPSHPLPPYVDLRPLAPFYNKVCNREKEIHPFVEKQLLAWEAGDTETLIQTTPSIFDLFTEGNAKKGAPFIDLRAGRDWLRASDPFVLFQHVAIKVQRLLKERNEGPNILLEAMLEALDNHSFLQQVEGKFKAIIVDEFQDTDPLQWAIFSKFKPDLLLCVGDPKQSIYAFRGANLATFWEAKHHFSHIYHLSNNYRSDPKLIETFNTLFNIEELSYIPIKAKRPSLSETPFHMVVGNQRYFFSYIAAHIQEGKKNAILVKDRYQAAAITTYLETLNIPVASQATPNITKGKAFHVLKLGLPPEFSDEGDFADYRQLLELVKQGRDLEELALLDEYDHPELKRVLATHPDAVHIITTHTSKGLEFDVVFALGTAFDLPEPNEESLRLLYVAATRAKETLHLFHDPEQTLSSTSLLFSKVPIPEHTPLTQECTVTPKKPYNTPPPVKTLPIDYPPPPRYLSFSAIANPNVRAEDRLHYPTTAELPPGKETGHLIHLQIERRIELGRPCTDLTGTSLAGKEALVDALIEQAFALPLDGFCLNDVPYQDMLQEHEFQYPHMKGFIDLVFRYKNRIYLIDWKTNLLPDYDEETLHKEMLAHDYYTQANIYKEALRQAGLPLVKSFYIFIRGPGVIHVD